MRLKAFTIVELMIVLVIVAILASLAIVQLSGPKEEALKKGAQSSLKLIAAAEKIYRMETGQYINASDSSTINSILRTMLPVNAATAAWTYTITNASSSRYTVTATRASGPRVNTNYTVNETSE